MPDTSLWQIIEQNVGQALAVFGSVTVIASGLATFLGNHLSSARLARQKAQLDALGDKLRADLAKDAEIHKLGLKRREFLFDKEVKAASAVMALRRKIEPRFSHPDMDWEESMATMHRRLPECEKLLAAFIIEHGPVLDMSLVDKVEELRSTAENRQFDVHDRGGFNEQTDDETAAFLQELRIVETQIMTTIRG